jgi:polysaccharide biosynthesis/export protein
MAPPPQQTLDGGPLTAGAQPPADCAPLAQLWHKRTHEGPLADYPIGPGDVLEVSVPAMDELKDRVVRVSGVGTITLPLIGVVQAAGLTEAEIRETIRTRLEVYMHAPQFNLFVRDYRSRQVAVIGAVAKPGLYQLASEADTILDMVTLAGGMTIDAAPRLLLIPGELADNGTTPTLAAITPAQAVGGLPSRVLQQADPLLIDLQHLTQGGQHTYLSLPARPGDVLVIPSRGQVLVQGWVEQPGSYNISPGLTVLGAVAAAGGPLFAADTSAVQVMRTGKHGEKSVYAADLEQIKRGEQPDIPMYEGDVIDVPSSTPKLVPYGFYRFFTSLFRVGASVPLY